MENATSNVVSVADLDTRSARLQKTHSGTTLALQYKDGVGRLGPVATIDTATLSPAIQLRLTLHGAGQKIGDETAQAGSLPEKWARVEAMIELLQSGQWERTRQSAQAAETERTLAALLAYKNASIGSEAATKLASWYASMIEKSGHAAVFAARKANAGWQSAYESLAPTKPVDTSAIDDMLSDLDSIA